MKTEDIDEQQIKVFGVSSGHENISITLSLREIKHLRRTLEFYSLVHPQLPYYTGDNYSEMIYTKFKKFGHITGRGKARHKFKIEEGRCSYQGCTETRELTIHHITPPLIGGNGKDNLKLLCPRHHLLQELNHILHVKELEVVELKDKIKKTENGENPEILGYQTLAKFKEENDTGTKRRN